MYGGGIWLTQRQHPAHLIQHKKFPDIPIQWTLQNAKIYIQTSIWFHSLNTRNAKIELTYGHKWNNGKVLAFHCKSLYKPTLSLAFMRDERTQSNVPHFSDKSSDQNWLHCCTNCKLNNENNASQHIAGHSSTTTNTTQRPANMTLSSLYNGFLSSKRKHLHLEPMTMEYTAQRKFPQIDNPPTVWT